MALPANVYTDADGWAHVQAAPGTQPYFIGSCFDSDDIPDPGSDFDPIWCLDEKRQFQQVGSTITPPDKITTTLTGLMEKTANWLDKFAERHCPFYIHFVQSKCGSRGNIGNWERIYTIRAQKITDRVLSNLMAREGGNATTMATSVSASPGRIDSRELFVSRQTTAEPDNLNDIWACDPNCAGACGPEIEIGDVLQAAADADGVGGTANVPVTVNGGAIWGAAAADPFAADENIMAGQCFELDKDTTRWLVVRDGDVAAGLEVAYSDDGGATWTNAVVAATVNEAATGDGALFAFDAEHIWLCTDDGNVFFSSDGGVTWVDQGALGASGASPLNAIDFIDANVGYCVGDADTIISTEDGGTNWVAQTATGGGNGLDAVQVFAYARGQHVLVGDDGGDLYNTWDGTTTWMICRP